MRVFVYRQVNPRATGCVPTVFIYQLLNETVCTRESAAGALHAALCCCVYLCSFALQLHSSSAPLLWFLLRSKEIEFTLPPGAFTLTPPRSRRGQQKLDIPTKDEQCSLSPGDATSGNSVRQRRFSSALLFPGRTDGTSSPLLSPSILLHCSAPSSPVPNYSPSPAHSPCLSPLPSVGYIYETFLHHFLLIC